MSRCDVVEADVKLQRMIKRTQQHLVVYVANRDVPATNNVSEPALHNALEINPGGNAAG
jgi:hypothetical protein